MLGGKSWAATALNCPSHCVQPVTATLFFVATLQPMNCTKALFVEPEKCPSMIQWSYRPSGLVLAMFSQICTKNCASTTRHQSTRSPTHHRLHVWLPDHYKFFQWHFVVLWVLKFYFMPTLKTFYSVYSGIAHFFRQTYLNNNGLSTIFIKKAR